MAPKGLIKKFQGDTGPRLLLVEPYLNDSHNCLAQGLMEHIPARWTLLALPGRFFRWRMRGAAAFLAIEAAEELAGPWDGLICSSMLGLAELKGLLSHLTRVPALVYFHENQLCYPEPGRADAAQQERDLYLAFSNLTSIAAAKRVLFNSKYHRSQVIAAARDLLARLPDAAPKGLLGGLEKKSAVLPVPLPMEEATGLVKEPRTGPLRLIWNHRWEHDKAPQDLFSALFALADSGADFEAAILGPRPAKWISQFDEAPQRLGKRLKQLGPVDERRDYWRWLYWADAAISTALQEYQGLSLAEAVHAGCRPLAPNDLVYPEIYQSEFRYSRGQLRTELQKLIDDPQLCRDMDFSKMVEYLTWPACAKAWQQEIEELMAS
jgi:glycosyltransferase involved in cell wall biosynthesis